jgi:hypothetical protein
MRYRQKEWNDLESGQRLYGPEPIFGEYKDESDDNWTVETIRYVFWQYLQKRSKSSVESDIMNENSTLANKESKLPAY